MKVAIIGATGLVGRTMISVLEERNFPVTDLIPVASSKIEGRTVLFRDKKYMVETIESALDFQPDIALFSAGSDISLEIAPRFAEIGCYVVDNSSAWRMDPDKKLIVPEINGTIVVKEDRIIANPNCSTIQLVAVLAPIHKQYRIKRVVISTYQSVSGSGMAAIEQLESERAGNIATRFYPHPIDLNCLPHIDEFLENGYTREEMKLVQETQKILGDADIRITATTVRVPVQTGHSESVNIELNNPYNLKDIVNLLGRTPGVVVHDQPSENKYPMPLEAAGKDEVFVGRIRVDESQDHGLNLWIVSDNLRKGAATNTVQIAELISRKFF